MKSHDCILLLDSLKPENKYLVSSECLKKSEYELLNEYREFLEIVEIDRIGLSTKKMYNIHASDIKQFFIILSRGETIKSYYKHPTNIKDMSFIFAFWLFGSYMQYIDRIYVHHKYTYPTKAQLEK